MTTSAPRSRPCRTASNATEPGSEPSGPVTISQPARCAHPASCSTAAARNVSAAPSTTVLPSSLLQVPGELADRRRLAGAVDAGDHDHRRLVAQVDRGPRPVRAMSASSSRAARSAPRRPRRRRTRPPCSSLPTTSAVVRAPTSAMISASSRRSHVSRRACPRTASPGSRRRAPARVLERFSRRRRKNPRRCSGSGVGGDAAALAPSPVMKTSVQSRAIAVRDDSARGPLRTDPRRPAARRRPDRRDGRRDGRRCTGRSTCRACRARRPRTSPRRTGRSSSGSATTARPCARAASSASTTTRRRSSACTSCPPRAAAGSRGSLLAALEDAARDLGYGTVRLDTGARQPHAQALYESAGYRAIGNFNANPVAAYWGEKRLAG